jgi:ankyrin repeat protein
MHGNTALHWAAANGHADLVRLLLDREAEIESRNKVGSPLFPK